MSVMYILCLYDICLQLVPIFFSGDPYTRIFAFQCYRTSYISVFGRLLIRSVPSNKLKKIEFTPLSSKRSNIFQTCAVCC